MQEIELVVDAEGNVALHVRGVLGTDCLDLTRPLEEALGNIVEERTFTTEYDETRAAERERIR